MPGQTVVTIAELENTFKQVVTEPITPTSRIVVLSSFISLAGRYSLASHGRCGPSHPSIQIPLSDLSMVQEYGWCSFVLDEIIIGAANAVKNLLDQGSTSNRP